MRFISTRGGVQPLPFAETVLAGLAGDGGLFMPESIPDVSGRLAEWRSLDFRRLAQAVFEPFVADSLDSAPLAGLVDRAYATFDHPEVTPLVRVGPVHVLELFHGPTLAFKDVALQFLGCLFEHLLESRGENLTVLGATSGDTGSAAIHALKGKRRVEVFILFPHGRVSPMQERQMTTVPEANVHCVAVDGSFDDAQSIVKTLFNDRAFNDQVRLGAINSINWARLMAQIVYFFYAYFRLLERPAAELAGGRALRLGDPVRFAVPTGNFGHLFAGWLAKRMGLPIERLVLAANSNDILHRFVASGEYRRGELRQTWSPSMDIQVASNFERYLFELADRDAALLGCWMADFERDGALRIEAERFARVSEDLLSAAVSEDETLATIREVYERHGYLLDPHSAVGYRAARLSPGAEEVPTICMATAHPAKFGDAIRRATGRDPDLPPALAGLERLPARVQRLPARADSVKAHLLKTLGLSARPAPVTAPPAPSGKR
jgi:threonine synthase